LLTQTGKGERSRHRVYFVDELYQELGFKFCDTECASNLYELIGKAIRKRDRMLHGTTNYFSGITGRVEKIL